MRLSSTKPGRWMAPAAWLLVAILSLLKLNAADMTTVYMIGDSTMANKNTANGNPERGWGQLLPELFQPGVVVVVNAAKDGRSTKSFRDEGLWKPVLEAIRPGDWLIIQFGHNDQKKDKPQLYADAATAYRENLALYVKEARAKGAHPILATSIYRRNFTPDGKPKSSLGLYPETVRSLAEELGVPLVDLNLSTQKLLEETGEEKSKALFLHFAPGELPFYPEGKADNTHLSEKGARKVALLFANELRSRKIPLSQFLDESKLRD